jgi:hypothetical protein
VRWMERVHDEDDNLRGDIRELGHRMDIGFAELGARFEGRIDQRFAQLDNKIEQRHAELLKWSFVFWVGAVAAISALAGVLR